MPRFRQTVTELHSLERRYEVEADTAEEAFEKMSKGEDTDEMTLKAGGVVDRTVHGVPQEIL